MAKLSIITINLNNKIGLIRTIESVTSQVFTEFEFIIIDGGSKDGSIEVIHQYKQHITYWVSEPDKGIYNAMNKGIVASNGEYCLFLNSGDWLFENILNNIFNETLTSDIIYFNLYLSYNDGKIKPLKYPSTLSMSFFYQSTIGHQSTFIKRSLFDRFGQYTESYRIHADYEFWIKSIIVNNCTVDHYPLYLSYYQMDGISSKPNPWAINEREEILNTYLPARIANDYQLWVHREKEIEILLWYKKYPIAIFILEYFYKIIKNLSRLTQLGLKENV